MNVDGLMDKLEFVLVPARFGGVTVADCVDLNADEVLFILVMLGRNREQVLDRVLAG